MTLNQPGRARQMDLIRHDPRPVIPVPVDDQRAYHQPMDLLEVLCALLVALWFGSVVVWLVIIGLALTGNL